MDKDRRAALPGVDELFRVTGPRPDPDSTPHTADIRPSEPEGGGVAFALLAWVAAAIGARQIVGVGVGDPTAAVTLASGGAEGVSITLVDSDGDALAPVRAAVEAAGFPRVRTIPGPPNDVLGRLTEHGYDLVVLGRSEINARDQAMRLLRPGGVLGALVPPDGQVSGLRRFALDAADDPRYRVAVIPGAAGLTLLRIEPDA